MRKFKQDIKLMKKAITTIFGWFCICISITTLAAVSAGQNRYECAQEYMVKYDIGTDQDIEYVLSMYGFDLEWHESPTTWDFIKSNF